MNVWDGILGVLAVHTRRGRRAEIDGLRRDADRYRGEVEALIATAQSKPTCTTDASCEDGDHTLTWPCDFALGTGRAAADNEPSKHDSGRAVDLTARQWTRPAHSEPSGRDVVGCLPTVPGVPFDLDRYLDEAADSEPEVTP
jgi:hypothetical protein